MKWFKKQRWKNFFFKKTFNHKKAPVWRSSKDSNSKVCFFITVNKIVLWMVWQALQIIIHKPILATALNLLDSMEIVQDQIHKLQKEIYVLHLRQEDNIVQKVIFRRLLLEPDCCKKQQKKFLTSYWFVE